MRRVKIESMEDMEALPEGEWVETHGGLHAKFVYSVDRENNKLTIALPEEVAKRIGDRLCATFDGGKIVISEVSEIGDGYMENMNWSCAMAYKGRGV